MGINIMKMKMKIKFHAKVKNSPFKDDRQTEQILIGETTNNSLANVYSFDRFEERENF
jgi:hypothetical protein